MKNSYRKSKGNAGLHGIEFQVHLLTVFMLNALRTLKGWRISTENEAAGKFDDVVIELADGTAILLQAKHKDSKRVTRDQLLSDNSKNADFSLSKYFLSYQEIKTDFNVKSIIICTNTDVDKKKLMDILTLQCARPDNILHYEEGSCSFIKFNENILPCLKVNVEAYYEKNLKGKGMSKEVVTEENLKDFLEKLQFFTRYPSGNDINKIIDQLLSRLNDSRLWTGTTSQEICKKVEDWFKQSCGEYLTEAHAKALFCEIQNDKYCKTLKQYNVFFQQDYNFKEERRIFHISVENDHLLHILKTHHVLQDQKVLYLFLKDNLYKEMIEAFQLPKYVFLLLIFSKVTSQQMLNFLNAKLRDILDKHSFKKIILIGRNQLVQQLELDYDVQEVDKTVSFLDLGQVTQERLIKNSTITFQGEDVSLEELLEATSTEDFSKALNLEILEKLLKDEKVKVGAPLLPLDNDSLRYYINRTIERETNELGDEMLNYKKKKEIYTEESILNVREKVLLISDCAGMGKSTILAKLAVDIKQNNPHLWVIRVELNNYTRILRDMSRKRKRVIKISEFLDSNEATKLTNQLEKFVFSINQKIVILLDGFDEISPDYTELILSLLSQSREAANFAKIIVTTRPNMNEELEKILQVKPFVLQPFTKKDQITFLTSYWAHNLELEEEYQEKCEKYSVALINKLSFWIMEENNFAAIPLQVRMLAEIFEENIRWSESTNWEGCKEFLDADELEPKLPERMKVTELYDMFIDKKLEIYIDKLNPTGTAMGHSFNTLFDQYFQNHQSLAIEMILGSSSILDKKDCNLFSRYRYDPNMKIAMLKIGIVQETNGKIDFVHRTFAEYFVAKTILEVSEIHNQQMNQDVGFQKFFIDEILCNPEFNVIRSFIESVLVDVVDSLPSDTFGNYELFVTSVLQSCKYRSKLIHLLAREGCVSTLQLILKCINFETIKDKEEVYITDLLNDKKLEASNTLLLLKYLVEHGGVNIKMDEGETPLHFAAANGHLEMIKFLIGKGGNISIKNKNQQTVLHPASQYGHLEVVKFLMQCGLDPDVEDDCRFSSLHLAAVRGQLNIVEFLMSAGANVNALNKDGCTPLILASWKDHFDTVRYLVDHGVDINIGDNNDFTALHAAAQHGHLLIFKFLVESGVDIHSSENGGFTSLHIAAQQNHLHIINFLVKRGVQINTRTNKGSTCLHIACLNGHLDAVKFLVRKKVDVNAQNNSGMTALHLAAQKGHLGIVQFLIEQEAYFNVENNFGYAVIDEAADQGHLDIVKYLVECGADINRKNKTGRTMLHLTVSKGHLDVTQLLLDRGADINFGDCDGFNGLHLAAYWGHLDSVKFLIERKADVRAVNNDGCIPLHLAVWKNHFNVVQYLVEKGADVNAVEKNGISSLHAAALYGYLNIMEFLVEHGADVNISDNNDFNPLQRAVQEKYLNVVEFLLKCNANIDASDDTGFTSLHSAAQDGHLDLVKVLIENNANINAINNAGCTALHTASCQGHLDVVKCLVENGTDINARSKSGSTPLLLAADEGHLNIVRFLTEHGGNIHDSDDEGFTCFQLACRMGRLPVAKFLTEKGVDVHAVNKDGCNSLYLASWKGHLSIVQYLVDQGVDVNLGDSNGFTSFQAAVQHGHLDVVKFFTEHGVDVSRGDNNGFTPLHIAAQGNHLHIIKYLMECNLNINIRTKNGSTPLHTASWNGHVETARHLVKCGANIGAKNNDGFTCLHLAVKKSKLDIVQFLVEQGVDVNVQSNEGAGAIHFAFWKGHMDIIKYLVEHDANIKTADNYGFTGLHIAAQEGHLDTVKFLVEQRVDINAINKDGSTPLHLAAWKGHLPIVEYLVNQGADINNRNNKGCTALHLVAQSNLDIIEFLVQHGADMQEVTGLDPPVE